MRDVTYDVHGKGTAYNKSNVYSGPCVWYIQGSYPPIMTTKAYDNGRAVAGGFVSLGRVLSKPMMAKRIRELSKSVGTNAQF